MRSYKKYIIVDKTFNYALGIIDYTEKLRGLHKYEMASQLFKSGTSIGANTWETQNGESPVDIIQNLNLAAKEANETEYWIKLCNVSKYYPNTSSFLESELKSIIRIISKIISSSKKR